MENFLLFVLAMIVIALMVKVIELIDEVTK